MLRIGCFLRERSIMFCSTLSPHLTNPLRNYIPLRGMHEGMERMAKTVAGVQSSGSVLNTSASIDMLMVWKTIRAGRMVP